MTTSIRSDNVINIVKQSELVDYFVEGVLFEIPSIAVIRQQIMILQRIQAVMPKLTALYVRTVLMNRKHELKWFYEEKLGRKLKFKYEVGLSKPTSDILSAVINHEEYWEVIVPKAIFKGLKTPLYEAIRRLPELQKHPEMTVLKISSSISQYKKHLVGEINLRKRNRQQQMEVEIQHHEENLPSSSSSDDDEQPIAHAPQTRQHTAQPLVPSRRMRVEDLPDLDLPAPNYQSDSSSSSGSREVARPTATRQPEPSANERRMEREIFNLKNEMRKVKLELAEVKLKLRQRDENNNN